MKLSSILLTATIALGSLTATASPAAHATGIDSLRAEILSNVTGAPERPALKASILDFGAKGDGVKDCRPAFERAMRRADKRGGLYLTVPAGTYYMCGPLTLTSNVWIELAEGAVLKFSPDPAHYPIVETGWEGTYLSNYSPLIYGRGLHNVAITGQGTIDGNAMTTFATWKPLQRPAMRRSRELNHREAPQSERIFGEGDYLRPHLLQVYECEGVTLEGVKIINSPFWCVHLLKSNNIICRSLRYDAKLVNNDGIDPESSSNIIIEDIHFDNGDDNIAIKSGRDNDGWRTATPTRNVLIRNCHFKGLHAVVLGSEMSGGISGIIVEDCDYAGYCKRGIYVKTNPDRGGYVRDLWVSNCTFGDVEDLFYVTSKYAGEGLDNTHFSEIRGLHVDGLHCKRASAAALVLQGTTAKPVTDVTFRNVEVGEARIGLSFSDTRGVSVNDCHIGGTVDIPTQVTAADKIFDRDSK
ncbi:MAG: glycoside hydrolase family 28 protein [Duncaniella sp.]|nr:glycoside hydrolase family 28 protein [Duncaniella sp.]